MGRVHVKASRAWGSLKLTLMTHLLERYQKYDLLLLFTVFVQTCDLGVSLGTSCHGAQRKDFLVKTPEFIFSYIRILKSQYSPKQSDTDSYEYLAD